MKRRLGLSLRRAVVLSGLMLAVGCKRQRAPKVPEVWDEEAASERTEALGALAPPWPAPTKAVLEDGLLTFWLHEQDTPVAHVRLLLPIHHEQASPEVVATSAEMLRYELRRRVARYDARVEVTHRPGRVEVAVHAPSEHLDTVLRWVGWSMSRPDPSPMLVAARDRVRGDLDLPGSDEVAAAVLTDGLLGLPAGPQRLEAQTLQTLDADTLVEGWTALADPRDAVMLVHAARPAKDAREQLRRLSSTWQGRGRAKVSSSALSRLRREQVEPAVKPSHLLGDSSAPLWVATTKTRGGPVLILGRVLSTPDARSRSVARLSQRVLQEELDVRLALAGEHAVVMVVVPLTGRDVSDVATKTIAELGELTALRQPKQRLFQTAQLWLGARVVQASLDGEDWTRLFSEAIDLADDDAGIGTALARDAGIMLSLEPDDLVKWQRQWLDPAAGEPGWQWAVAGADDPALRKLSRLAPLREVEG